MIVLNTDASSVHASPAGTPKAAKRPSSPIAFSQANPYSAHLSFVYFHDIAKEGTPGLHRNEVSPLLPGGKNYLMPTQSMILEHNYLPRKCNE